MADMEVIRSGRRTLALEVRGDGTLMVRAPAAMSEAEIRRFVAEKADWIESTRARLSQSRALWGGEVLTADELAALKRQAQEDLAARLAYWAQHLGVTPQKLSIRSQHTRWGSCSSHGNISLNALLMLAPQAVRDYVVVHELCHLKQMDHSPRFWAEVARALPDYHEPRAWLRANGAALLQRNPET